LGFIRRARVFIRNKLQTNGGIWAKCEAKTRIKKNYRQLDFLVKLSSFQNDWGGVKGRCREAGGHSVPKFYKE